MFKGSKLVRTNGKRATFDVSPGGPISDVTAERLLEHSLMSGVDDPGLLPDKPQSLGLQHKGHLRSVNAGGEIPRTRRHE